MPQNFSRMNGFRRNEGMPYMAQFGYGGAGFGGFGRKGQYGGWRSNYPYGTPMKQTYPVNFNAQPVNMQSNTTLIFALVLIGLIVAGLFFGMRSKYFGGGGASHYGVGGGSRGGFTKQIFGNVGRSNIVFRPFY